MNPELEALLKEYGITPEQFAQMADAGVFDEQMAALQPQMEMAQGAMGQQMPQGRMVSGYYVPPSPFSNLAGLIGRGVGAYSTGSLMGKQGALIDSLRAGQSAAGIVGMKDRDNERRALIDLLRQGEPELKDPYGAFDGVPDLLRRPG